MNDDIEPTDNDPTQQEPTPAIDTSELDTLKMEAIELGMRFHPSIGVDALKTKITAFVKATTKAATKAQPKPVKLPVPVPLSHEDYKRMSLKERKRKAGNLVRVNVANMNPNKKDWEGEILSVGSAKLGTYKKYVLFNTDDGWHVPHIIYEAMKDRKCSVFTTVKDHLGNKIRKSRLINEFNIEVLPPLTKAELKELAQRQAMAGTLVEE